MLCARIHYRAVYEAGRTHEQIRAVQRSSSTYSGRCKHSVWSPVDFIKKNIRYTKNQFWMKLRFLSLTCNNPKNQVFSSGWMLTFDPETFKTIKCIKINKIGTAKAGDNREPSSIWCQPNGEEKVIRISKIFMWLGWCYMERPRDTILYSACNTN